LANSGARLEQADDLLVGGDCIVAKDASFSFPDDPLLAIL
jgi:hypothetical protein